MSSEFTSLSLSFSVCKMGTVTLSRLDEMLLGPKRDGDGEGDFGSSKGPSGRHYLQLPTACVCRLSGDIAGDFTEGCCPAGLMLSQFRGSTGVRVTGCEGWQIWVQSPALTLPL